MISSAFLERIVEANSEIRKMFMLAAKLREDGKQPIDLSLGQPNIPPPQEYYDALSEINKENRVAALEGRNLHGYIPSAGLPSTREAVAEMLKQRYGIPFSIDDIVMTAGAANALMALSQTFLHANGRRQDKRNIIVAPPYFLEYANIAFLNNGSIAQVRTNADFDFDLESFDEAVDERSRAMIITTPNNPTGTIYPDATLQQVAEILERKAERYGPLPVIEDRVYDRITVDGQEVPTLAKYWPHTIHVNSWSKSLGIAGERLGYIAFHPDFGDSVEDKAVFVEALTHLMRPMIVNTNVLQQRVIERIGPGMVGDMQQYLDNTRKLADKTAELGFRVVKPAGAFYVFPQLPRGIDMSEFNAAAMSGDDPLLVVPGHAFGGPAYARHFRMSACVAPREIDRACEKLEHITQTF